MMNGTEV